MAYVDDFALSNDATFQSRIKMSMIKQAIVVLAAAPSTDATIDNKRTSLAKMVLNNPDVYILIFSLAAIETGGGNGQPLTAVSTDTNIDTAIITVWNDIAGVTTRD